MKRRTRQARRPALVWVKTTDGKWTQEPAKRSAGVAPLSGLLVLRLLDAVNAALDADDVDALAAIAKALR